MDELDAIDTLIDLKNSGYVNEREYEALDIAIKALWKVIE